MKKKPIRIFDAYGKKIFQTHVDDPSKGLSGLRLDTLHVPYAKLPAMDFSGCEMYWPLLEGADLSFCDFRDAVLAGANMDHCILRHANLRRTRLVADAMGYFGSMFGADLTSALLDQACFRGVEYDDTTIFPEGFDPVLAGMKKRG